MRLGDLGRPHLTALNILAEQGNPAAAAVLDAWRVVARARRLDEELTAAEVTRVEAALRVVGSSRDPAVRQALDQPDSVRPHPRPAPLRARSTLAAERQALASLEAQVAPPGRLRRAGAAERWAVAVHEAGHAIAYLARGTRLRLVTIDDAGNGACYPVRDPRDPVADVAGAVAAQLTGLSGHAGTLSAADQHNLTDSLRQRGETAAWVASHRATARALLASRWPTVVAVAHALTVRGSLTGQEVEAVAHHAVAVGQAALALGTRLARAGVAPLAA